MSRWCITCCLLIWSWPVSSPAERPWLVGEHGDFAKFEFRGHVSFSAEQLAQALETDLSLISFARPLSPFSAFLTAVESQLRLGYLHRGFPQVEVQTEFDEQTGTIVVEIHEGARFRNGPVQVTADDPRLVPLIVGRLQERRTPVVITPRGSLGNGVPVAQEPAPLWVDNMPTSFTGEFSRQLHERITRTLHEAGYFDAQVDLELIPEGSTSTTRLEVAVETGRATTIGSIEVRGAERHAPNEILALLEIAEGMPCDLFARQEWERRLEQSGRFATIAITSSPLPDRPGEHHLCVELHECEDVPLLDEGLTAMDHILLKTCEWLNHPEQFDGDVALRGRIEGEPLRTWLRWLFSQPSTESDDEERARETERVEAELARLPRGSAEFCLVLTPNGSGLAGLRILDDAGAIRAGYVVQISSPQTRLWSLSTGQCLDFENSETSLAQVALTLVRNPTDAEGRKFGLNLGMGVSSVPQRLMQIHITPAFMLSQARSSGAEFDLCEGVLCGRWDAVRAEFEVATGRLIRMESHGDEELTWTLVVRPGAMEDLLSEFVGAQSRYQRLSTREAPFYACAEFVAGEAAWWAEFLENDQEAGRWNSVARLLRLCRSQAGSSELERGVAASLVSHTESDRSMPQSFFIPAPRELAASPTAWAGQFALQGNSALVMKGTSAWRVGREAASALALRDPAALAELERLSRDPECGPLTSLYAAEMLRYVHPALAQVWADRGLRRLDVESAHLDLRHFYVHDSPCGRMLGTLVAGLDSLPAEDVRQMFAGLDDDQLGELMLTLTDSSTPSEARLRRLAEQSWEFGLREWVTRRLTLHWQRGIETTQLEDLPR